MTDNFDDVVTLKLFADDVKLYSNIAAVSSNTSVNITEQLNKVAKLASDWQLPIAYSKCCVFNIGNKTPHHTPCTVDTENIPSVEEIIDLGILTLP